MILTKEKSVITKDSRMCLAVGAALGNKLPLHTPVSAMGETLAGGRSPDKIMKESTLTGQVLFPKKTPSAPKTKVKKRKTSSVQSQRTGSGLRINNKNLNTGLQLK